MIIITILLIPYNQFHIHTNMGYNYIFPQKKSNIAFAINYMQKWKLKLNTIKNDIWSQIKHNFKNIIISFFKIVLITTVNNKIIHGR